MQEHQFSIAGDDGDRLDVTIKETHNYENKSYNNSDLIIGVSSRGFKGAVQVSVGLDALRAFLQELQICHSELKGTVRWGDCRQQGFSIEIEFQTRGSVRIFVSLRRISYQRHRTLQNLLEVEFMTDQTYLKRTIEQLRSLLQDH